MFRTASRSRLFALTGLAAVLLAAAWGIAAPMAWAAQSGAQSAAHVRVSDETKKDSKKRSEPSKARQDCKLLVSTLAPSSVEVAKNGAPRDEGAALNLFVVLGASGCTGPPAAGAEPSLDDSPPLHVLTHVFFLPPANGPPSA